MRVLAAAFVMIVAASFSCPAGGEAQEQWNEYTIRPSDFPADAPKFEEFPAVLYKGANAQPLLEDSKGALLFRTRIRQWSRQRPNFAGQYILATWGCGTECAQITLINAVSGKVIMQEGIRSNVVTNVHDEVLTEGSLRFRPDSRLLVVIGMPEEEPKLRGISYFVMRDDHLDRVRFIHKSWYPD
jgi:hypothetical protein